MARKTVAISLRADVAYQCATGALPILLLTGKKKDTWRVLIHICEYKDPLDQKEAEKNLLAIGIPLDKVITNAIIGVSLADIKLYDKDKNAFKMDAPKHGYGTNFDVFKAQNGFQDDPIYGYEFVGMHLLLKPIVGVDADTTDGEIWEAETPFEKLCFDRACKPYDDEVLNVEEVLEKV